MSISKVLGFSVMMLIFICGLVGCPSKEEGAQIGDDDNEAIQVSSATKVALPPPPSFQKEHAPEKYTDSTYSVYGVRKNINTTLNQQVKVKGFIIEVYECPPCPKKAKDCPTCEKPKFWLSDRANGPKDKAMMVTDYSKEDPKTRKKITFEVGAQYIVSGTFAKFSNTGASDSNGLMIFAEANQVGAEQ